MGAPLTATELLDDLIADLEGKLNLAPGADLQLGNKEKENGGKQQQQQQQKKNNANNNNNNNNKKQKQKQNKPKKAAPAPADPNLPEICKLEFKVGLITKVWVHPDADKLYCEEIDVGEEGGPRRIASGLRKHYSEEEMLGKRVLVVSNLKAKNLVGFKSHGMVLCAAEPIDGEEGEERVEFVEPPEGAPLGEVVSFEGLPPPAPVSGAQVDKKKVFAKCVPGMRTNDECAATWEGHVFMTSAGPCRGKSVRGGAMR